MSPASSRNDECEGGNSGSSTVIAPTNDTTRKTRQQFRFSSEAESLLLSLLLPLPTQSKKIYIL